LVQLMKKCMSFILLAALLLPIGPLQAKEGNGVMFMYHRFGEERLPSTNISMAQFTAHLDYLQAEKFTIWPLGKLVDALKRQQPIPDKTVVLTVDDAYRSVYDNAFPLLQSRGIPFSVFVSSDYVDKKFGNYMSWDQMREMKAAGVEFALHSASHDHLILLREGEDKAAWQQRIREDLLRSQTRLREELGVDSHILAYPYGEYSEELANMVADLGMVGLGQHSGAVAHGSDLRVLPRFPQSEHYGELAQFITKANSLALPVEGISPMNPVLANAQPPLLRVTLAVDLPRIKQLQCYASGEGGVPVNWIVPGRVFEVQATRPIEGRRGRYNCTVPSQEAGRFYWFSQPWIIAARAEE
jgi:peptidoglycan/xylan/chitin deacetylase (PgdA/CDA1 family)